MSECLQYSWLLLKCLIIIMTDTGQLKTTTPQITLLKALQTQSCMCTAASCNTKLHKQTNEAQHMPSQKSKTLVRETNIKLSQTEAVFDSHKLMSSAISFTEMKYPCHMMSTLLWWFFCLLSQLTELLSPLYTAHN